METINAERLDALFAESAKLHEEWLKINVTKTGRLRLRLKPEQAARSEEIRKQSDAIRKEICQITNEDLSA